MAARHAGACGRRLSEQLPARTHGRGPSGDRWRTGVAGLVAHRDGGAGRSRLMQGTSPPVSLHDRGPHFG